MLAHSCRPSSLLTLVFCERVTYSSKSEYCEQSHFAGHSSGVLSSCRSDRDGGAAAARVARARVRSARMSCMLAGIGMVGLDLVF